jgi:ribosomal protein L13E
MQVAKPIVKKGYIARKGRGYSIQELQEINLNPRVARKNGVPVDVWRQTKHTENVEQLKPVQKAIEAKRREKQQTDNKKPPKIYTAAKKKKKKNNED